MSESSFSFLGFERGPGYLLVQSAGATEVSVLVRDKRGDATVKDQKEKLKYMREVGAVFAGNDKNNWFFRAKDGSVPEGTKTGAFANMHEAAKALVVLVRTKRTAKVKGAKRRHLRGGEAICPYCGSALIHPVEAHFGVMEWTQEFKCQAEACGAEWETVYKRSAVRRKGEEPKAKKSEAKKPEAKKPEAKKPEAVKAEAPKAGKRA